MDHIGQNECPILNCAGVNLHWSPKKCFCGCSLAVKTTEVIGKILTGVEFETTFITVGLTGITVESTGNRFMFPLFVQILSM